MKFITSLLFCLLYFAGYSQVEYLTKFDRSTGTFSLVNSLPGVNYIRIAASAYDKNNQRFIFHGIDFDGIHRLYCIDAVSGNILSQPILKPNSGEYVYDNLNNKLYGIFFNTGFGKMQLLEIDIPTGNSEEKGILPFNTFKISSAYFNTSTNSYVILSASGINTYNLTTNTNSVLPFTFNFSELAYDNSRNRIYAKCDTASTICEIDPSNGAITQLYVDPFPGYSQLGVNSFDETTGIYTYSNNLELVSFDVNTRTVVANPSFPDVMPGENIIEIHYDNNDGTLYTLHWKILPNETSVIENESWLNVGLTIYPNPTQNGAKLHLSKTTENAEVIAYNVIGETMYQQSFPSLSTLTLNTENWPKGCYLILIKSANTILGTKKLIVE